ncbi:MAG: toprim domain-containing protein [Clostridia bacterium]|nr:toprim domain-containing protein [Clostridia bacterium]
MNYYYYKVYKKDVEKEFNTYLSTHTIKETSSNVDLRYIIKENLLTSADGETRSKAFSRVYAYLTSRGFERFVIENMIKHNCLMVDKNYNLCFITYEDEEKTNIVAITKKGTLTNNNYKCNYTKERYTGFFYKPKNTTTPKALFIFESCLDLFSFVQLVWQNKIKVDEEYCCISLNGANNRNYIYKVLNNYSNINNIFCCLENDYKGKQSTDQIKKQMIKNTYDLRGIIQGLIKYNNGHLIKDWNECLKFSNYIDVDIKQFSGSFKISIQNITNGLDTFAPQALTRKRLVGNKATASALTNEPSDLP